MSSNAQRIRALNDAFRTSLSGRRVMMTAGVDALDGDFNGDNDPHGEHDFGSIEVAGLKVFWKIDAYDPTMTYGSEDPANPDVTTRVMTIMLADEY